MKSLAVLHVDGLFAVNAVDRVKDLAVAVSFLF